MNKLLEFVKGKFDLFAEYIYSDIQHEYTLKKIEIINESISNDIDLLYNRFKNNN